MKPEVSLHKERRGRERERKRETRRSKGREGVGEHGEGAEVQREHGRRRETEAMGMVSPGWKEGEVTVGGKGMRRGD